MKKLGIVVIVVNWICVENVLFIPLIYKYAINDPYQIPKRPQIETFSVF